jgi:hypothetical protein
MNPEIKRRWVWALRSGSYKQGRSCLHDGSAFCCLGVLTDLYANEKGLTWFHTEKAKTLFYYALTSDPEQASTLPNEVIEWAGLRDGNPDIKAEMPVYDEGGEEDHVVVTDTCLAEVNDGGKTFMEIAQLIEDQL